MALVTFKWDYFTAACRERYPELARRIDLSLNASWKEGVITQLMIGALDYFLIPYALALGASPQEIGFLVSIPHLLAASSQFFAVRTVRLAGSRTNLLVRGTAVQAIFLVPLGLLPLFSFSGRIALLIVLMIIFRVTGAVIGPSWGSLMSDYLPEDKRGEYFGWRSRLTSLAGIAGVGLWGFLLSGASSALGVAGFVFIFVGAAIFRFASLYYMNQMVDLPMHFMRERTFSWTAFLLKARESNFAKFLSYAAGITFTTQLSVAYFSVYLLQERHLDYAWYTAVQLASVVSGLIAFPLWGKQADQTGNAQVLKATSILIPLIPLFWSASVHPIHFILAELFSGFAWSGFNLCATNFIYDAVPPSRRVRSIGYFNLINSSATFLGASVGGYLINILPPVHGSSIITLFIISAILRFSSHFFLSRRFREVRAETVRVRRGRLFLNVLGVRVLAGRNVE